MSHEVVVVGAGIVGAAVARELSVRGVRVCLVEGGEVAGGSTGLGEGNVLCSDKDAGPELALARAGLELYAELETRLGERAQIRRKGALIVHRSEATWAAEPARVARLRAAGVAGSLVSVGEVRSLEPALTGELWGGSWFPDDLQCAPRAIARALAAEAGEAGAEVLTGRRVEGVMVAGGHVHGVHTATGSLGADAVVLAAGAWSAALAASAGLVLPIEPRKGQLVRLAVAPSAPPMLLHKVVDGAYLGSVASAGAGLEVTTVIETTWAGDVLVGSSRERRGFDVEVDHGVSAAMLARAVRLAPRLDGLPVAGAWAGLRPWLPDGLPAIGPSRAVAGLWAATGHEGAGVALGPITGRLVAQAYCVEAVAVDLEPFGPDRFA